MRIQHNIMAMNAYRNYSNNTSALSKNLEKLSSGYKINRAGDDAAGLAISEKMRAQITGLNAAQKNVKDGISLVKTAEGAMQEIQDMLNRMDYLATQSANGTYDNETDRYNLQKEVNQLKSEINRIADSANFNGIKLLDGSQASKASLSDVAITQVNDAANVNAGTAQKGIYEVDLTNFKAANATTGTAAGSSISIKVGGVTVASAKMTSATDFATGADFNAEASTVSINNVTFKVTVANSKITLEMQDTPKAEYNGNMTAAVDGTVETPTVAENAKNGNHAETLAVTVKQQAIPESQRIYAQGYFALTADDIVDGMQLKIGNETYTFAIGADSKFKNAANVVDLTDKNATDTNRHIYAAQRLTEVAASNKSFKVTSQNSTGRIDLTEKEGGVDHKKNDLVGGNTLDGDWTGLVQKGRADSSSGLTLQIGDTADSYNQLNVIVGDMHTNALGISNIDISQQASAQSAIETIRNAINYVSGIRGDLGATQNRLEHTQNNLSVMAENIQDAESTIRDTDVAEEMMSYVKNNILVQSAQAMLAQANQVPQGVLQLLG